MGKGDKMNDKEYTIENSMSAGGYEGKFGKMSKYTIQVEGVGCELSQKESTPAPKTGDKIFGHIEDGQYGKKFVKGQSSGFSKGGFTKADPNTMLLAYSKDVVVAFINAGKIKEEKEASIQITNFVTLFRGLYNTLSKGKNPVKKETVVSAKDEPPMPTDDEIDIDEIEMPF